jgi:hypothetical protein
VRLIALSKGEKLVGIERIVEVRDDDIDSADDE